MQPEKDFRLTRQRQIILEEMRRMRPHPNACELYDAVKSRLPHISLATVYRNLEILSEKGFVRKIITSGRQKRFDINAGAHYHAHCILCGTIVDIPVATEVMRVLPEKPDGLENFRVMETRVEFFGHCGACRSIGTTAEDEDSRRGPVRCSPAE
ncbi:MAG: transcriptional repressor [Syntrophobacter sp.]